MRRSTRLTLSAATLAASVAASLCAATPAFAVLPDGLTPQQKAIVKQAEQALGSMTTVEAHFSQTSTSPDGTTSNAEGKIEINRPGKMRVDYAPPSPILLVADGTVVAYVDRQLNQATFVPLSSTPAGILLRENASFSDPDVTLVAVREKDQVAELDVQLSSDPTAGMMTMIFAEHPFELKQWRIKDAQGIVTDLSLEDIKTGVTFDKNDFYQPNLKKK